MDVLTPQLNQIHRDRASICLSFLFAVVGAGRALRNGEAALLPLQGKALLLAAIAVLLLSYTPAYANGTRRWAVAALRLLACLLLPTGSSEHVNPLKHAPAGPAVDAVRTFVGSRALWLGFISLALPLDLPDHLAVQALCLALMLCRIHTCCDLPLLANPTQRRRIAALHATAVGSFGVFGSPEQLLGGPRAQCTALLAFLQLFCGGVLPTVAVMRWTWLGLRAAAQADARRRRTERQQDGSSPPSSSGSVCSSPGGSSGTLCVQSEAGGDGEAASSEDGGDQARAAVTGGESSGSAAPHCWLCAAGAAQHLPHWEVWLLECAFPPGEGLPAALAFGYLPLLAAGCWLAACLLADATN